MLFIRKTLFFTLLLLVLSASTAMLAQTPGLIVKAAVAGRPVLDPNGDNYVSVDNEGFVTDDELESEIPFVPIVHPNGEPTSDVATGPSCGFTDLVDAPSQYHSTFTYLSPANNWMFRFRLGNYASNSKGYSILVDTDGLFGASGTLKDPNYVVGNPGFEIEILLVTNIGIRLNDVDGTTAATTRTTLSYNDFCQKSVALSTNCGNADYFYDFYIPVSVITTHFPSFSASTPVRITANTVISTQSVLAGGPSDIAGVNDAGYGGNYGNAWTSVIDASLPAAPNTFNSGLPPVRSATPTVNSPLAVGATTVSGTSTEPNGTTIRLYVNGSLVGTTTVSGGVWSLTGIPALTLSASVKATAQAASKSVSYDANVVTVGATCSAVPTISCQSAKGIVGSGPAGAPAGTTIRIYGPNSPTTLLTSTTTDALNAFLYNCAGGTNCSGGGPNCIATGVYWITAQEAGKCESPKTLSVCIGTVATPTTTPTISTSPVLRTTTSITGTATTGNTVLLYIDNILQSTTTAGGGTYTFSGLSLSLGQVLTVYAVHPGRCTSSATTATVVEVSTAPIVKSPIVTGATTISGTSVEAAGTLISISKNGSALTTTTVDANGNWSVTGLAALVGGDVIRATATAFGESVSVNSNAVTVQSRTTAPVITGSYIEGAILVLGTSTSPTLTAINVYIDGVLIGTGTVAAGIWSVGVGLTDLYPGGVLTATATESGKAESLPSSSVSVSCANPLGSLGVNVLTGTICLNTKASIQVLLSQSDAIYTLWNNAETTAMGSSVLGTGGTITLPSVRVTSTQTFIVKAIKIPSTTCSTTLSTSATVTVTQPSNTSGVTSGDYFWIGSSGNSYWTEEANWVKWNGTSFQTMTVPPTTLDNVVIKPMESCIATQPSVITTSSASIPAVCRNLTIATGATLSLESSAAERAITLSGNWTNSGTLIPNSGTIKFNGGTTQTINNTNGNETFSSLIIEGNNTVLQPLVDVTLNATGVLQINGGALQLNGRKVTVTNPNTAAITRTAPGCVISENQNGVAELRWAIGTNTGSNYVFPLGTASKVYIPLTINLASGNIGTAGVNSIFAQQSVPANWPTGSEAVTTVATPAQAINRYWHLSSTQASGAYSATVTFSFPNTEDPTATILDVGVNGIKMQRWDGTSAWQNAIAGQTFSNTSPRTVSVPGITQFSWWSGGNNGGNPLPLTWIYFKGKSQSGGVFLEWVTSQEKNNASITVERSKDAASFTAISTIAGGGNTSVNTQYTFFDDGAFAGQNYYRIKQTDFDGAFSYSETIAVMHGEPNQLLVTPYPNPTRGSKPTLLIRSDKQQLISIKLYDLFGKIRYQATIETGQQHELITTLEGTDLLSAGLYILHAFDGLQTVTHPLVID
ncbi:T9SS type A sorting domain-containing protein [Pseudochryseolinea flava]|nr:T9SS type A sorting domain-containing protein [Pseudochryseolinea flava]